jgi:hypothetical protein
MRVDSSRRISTRKRASRDRSQSLGEADFPLLIAVSERQITSVWPTATLLPPHTSVRSN